MSQMPEKKVIGLTGTIGSGKSTVLSILSKWLPTADCDEITRRLLEKGEAGYRALEEAGLLLEDENGNLDKPATSARMFSDPAYKKAYEATLHPLILQKMKDWAMKQSGDCVIEVPLLFELGLQDFFDETWTVVTDEKTAIERTMTNRHIPEDEQRRRRNHQMPDERKIELADRIIENGGSLDDLRDSLAALVCLLHKPE